MVLIAIIILFLALGLLGVLNETGHRFYQDNRFWMTLSGIIVLAIASLAVV